MKKRWILVSVVGVTLAPASSSPAREGEGKGKKAEASTPFRLGKVQAEDLQVSVREVGVVDPVTKVDVKSAVSGRVVGLKVREGAVVKAGDVLAEVEPDVNQAQSLSDVQGERDPGRAEAAGRRARVRAAEGALRPGPHRPRRLPERPETSRDLAAETCKAAQMRYQIVEDRGIPISRQRRLAEGPRRPPR